MRFAAHVDSVQRGSGARFSLLPPENATGNYVKVVQRVPVKIVFDDLKQIDRYGLGPGMSVVPTVKIDEAGRSTGRGRKGFSSSLTGPPNMLLLRLRRSSTASITCTATFQRQTPVFLPANRSSRTTAYPPKWPPGSLARVRG